MKRVLSVLLSFVIVCSCFSCISFTSASAASFTARTTAPSASNVYYLHTSYGGLNECIHISGGSVLPNCVGYAWGRAYEILGSRPNLPKTDANTWYNNNKSSGAYSYGSTPKLGAILCWSGGSSGHVAVVEEINGSTITISESHYGGTRFNIRTGTQSEIESYISGFQGYIYIGDFGEPVNNPTPKMESTRFEYFDNGVRPVIEIENPSSISNVTFYLRFGETAEWKSYSGKYNLDKAWYCEASYDELNGTGDIVCHVYIYGKDGSQQCFVIEKPNAESSRYEFFNNGIRPVVEIENPSSISNVTFYLRFGTTAEWKSYSGKYNLDKAWYCEVPYNELNGSGELVCDVYIDGKDGSHEYMSINTETKITNIKEKRFEYFNNGVRPVISVSNHSKVSKVTFYLRYGKTAKWKSYSGTFNLEDSWYCEALLDDLAGEGQLVCDVYVDYTDGIHQYVGFPIGICKHTYDNGVVTKEATCTSNGVKTYTCSYCSDIYTETIPATGHTEVIDEGYEAINDKEGLTDGSHCSVCNEILVVQEIISMLMKIGDTDGDGKVTIMDATEIQRHIAQLTTISDDRLTCADTDKDGKVSIMDATMIQRFIAQLIPEL